MPVTHVFNKVTVLIPDDIRKLSNHDLLRAAEDVERQYDDYGLCFDVDTYQLELMAEKFRRRI